MPKDYLSQARVLIVDDEPSNVRLLERILALSGCTQIKGITDSRQALGLLLDFEPDIVLLDMNMPHFDGFAIMNQFQAVLDPDVYLPVLVLTADITAETKRKALASGAKDFVIKPIDQSEVVLRIKNLIENRFLHLEMQRQNAVLEQQVRERTARLEDALTELRSTQETIVKQERLRALGMMAGGIAHDFNNALTMMLGYGELLLPWLSQHASSRETSYLGHMIDAAKDAATVVSRLRDFYRPAENNEIRAPIDINSVVERVVSLTSPKWKGKCRAEGVQISVTTAVQDVPYVLGNISEVREVLTNLIFNAVDAMPEGGSISVATEQVGEMVAVLVTDTGKGMTESERQQCLEPFFTTKGEGGTGLGLSVVYGIVQRHGGKIEIESKVGMGTTFSVYLPTTDATLGAEASAVLPIDRVLHILVVDDQEIINELLAEHLKSDGHKAACAQNGQEALGLCKAHSFDLVITDQSMPGMNGVQLAGAIKECSPRTRVILLTGFGEEMLAAGGVPQGVDMVVGKPVSQENLRAAIVQVMASVELVESGA